jgi:hypothetical protein
MKYYLFMDESGDHGLTTLNPDFPVFLLCGILITEDEYLSISSEIDKLKLSIWKGKQVILHSRDIRKCEKEFQVLFDLEIKQTFYKQLNAIISAGNYTIIASAIQKDDYIKKYGCLLNDVYELALSFIIERAIFYLDDVIAEFKHLEIIIEKRGKKEDKKLEEHFQRLLSRGTYYVKPIRFNNYRIMISFNAKKDNINGLQLADLIAYPIARYVMEPNRSNPSFEIFERKIYSKGEKRYGLKIFP